MEATYTIPEIIIWYSSLVISIGLLVYYFLKVKQKRNKLAAISNVMKKDIDNLNVLIQNSSFKVGELKHLDVLVKIIAHIETNQTVYIELREKTSLEDFDKVIKNDSLIIKKIKKLNSIKDKDNLVTELKEVLNMLTVQKGKIDLIIPLVK